MIALRLLLWQSLDFSPTLFSYCLGEVINMTKYIIELEDDIQYLIINGRADNRCYTLVRPVAELEVLNSDYINEHYGELQDEAYQKGINDGSLDVKQRVEGAYQRGLEDAWEAAKKLFSSMADSDIEKAFPIEWNNGGFKALMNLQPQEAIAKLKAYEDKQKDRIEVGDEVIDKDGDTTIVTNIHERLFDGLCSDGSTMSDLFLEDVRKTGRHYDHIGKLLEAIRA